MASSLAQWDFACDVVLTGRKAVKLCILRWFVFSTHGAKEAGQAARSAGYACIVGWLLDRTAAQAGTHASVNRSAMLVPEHQKQHQEHCLPAGLKR